MICREELYYLTACELNNMLDGNPSSQARGPDIPTHTEDGVPIRKLYVTNLPSAVTRNELTKAFSKFGQVLQCALRSHGGRATEEASQPRVGYAFVTFANAKDAYSALCAVGRNERRPVRPVIVRGRVLIVRPADTWHQPPVLPITSSLTPTRLQPEEQCATENPSNPNLTQEKSEAAPTIVEILDRDCMLMILAYLSLPDLVRSERVCKLWQRAVRESLSMRRRLSTAQWQLPPTTATLRAALIRCGDSLRELCLDADPSRVLNGRTFKMVSRFCPRLEVLVARGSLESGGAAGKAALANLLHLRSLTLSACPRLDDSVLFPLLHRNVRPLLELRLDSDEHVNGVCFTNTTEDPLALERLSLSSMVSLRGSHLVLAAPRFASLRELEFDFLPQSCWRSLPTLLLALPSLSQLEDLSLLRCADAADPKLAQDLANALSRCTGLKKLRLWYNLIVRDAVLETVSRAARGLEWLEVCGCRWISASTMSNCLSRLEALQTLELSRMPFYSAYTGGDVLATVAALPRLKKISLKDNSLITSEELVKLVNTCHSLRELDVRGTIGADSNLLKAALEHCRGAEGAPLTLRLARTRLLPESSPPDDECRRLNLRLDWQDFSTDPTHEPYVFAQSIHNFEYVEDEHDNSDEGAFLDAVSDMLSDSVSDVEFDPEDFLWLQNVEWDFYSDNIIF